MPTLDEERVEILRSLSDSDLDHLLLRYAEICERSGNPELYDQLTRRIRREQQWPLSRWLSANIGPILGVALLFCFCIGLFFGLHNVQNSRIRNERVGNIRDRLIEYGYAEYVRNGDGEKQWRIINPKERNR